MQLKLWIAIFFTIFRSKRAVKLLNKYAIIKMPNYTLWSMADNFYDPISALIILRSSEMGWAVDDKNVASDTYDILGQIVVMNELNTGKYKFLSWLFRKYNYPDRLRVLGELYNLSRLVQLKTNEEIKNADSSNSAA